MKVGYTVHRVSPGTARLPVMFGDREILADVPSFEVELVGNDSHGSVTLRFVGNEAAEAASTYKVGDAVSAEFDPASA